MGFQGALGPPSAEPEMWQSGSTMGPSRTTLGNCRPLAWQDGKTGNLRADESVCRKNLRYKQAANESRHRVALTRGLMIPQSRLFGRLLARYAKI